MCKKKQNAKDASGGEGILDFDWYGPIYCADPVRVYFKRGGTPRSNEISAKTRNVGPLKYTLDPIHNDHGFDMEGDKQPE